MSANEIDIQHDVQLRIGSRPEARIWRANVGVAVPVRLCCRVCRQRGVIRFGVPGQADLSGIVRGGRRLEIECKTPTGRQSKEQRAFEAMILSRGGIYFVARSANEAEELLEAEL